MSISKKSRSKTAPKTSTKTSAAAALPDRRAMESFLAALGGRRGDDATAKAQDAMYEAWGDLDHHQAEGIRHGQPHRRQNGGGFFLDLLVDPGADNGIGGHDGISLSYNVAQGRSRFKVLLYLH